MTEKTALSASYQIEREAQAAKSLRASLQQLGESDESLMLDMAEGETSLFECIDALILRGLQDKGLIVGIDAVISDLEARKARIKKRIEFDRALIEQAMATAEINKLERPLATLSLSSRQLSLRIEQESDIPSEFWTPSAPKLDRKALSEALKSGRSVSGATLSNAAPSLTVRIK